MKIVRDLGHLSYRQRRHARGAHRGHAVLVLERALDEQKRLLDQHRAYS